MDKNLHWGNAQVDFFSFFICLLNKNNIKYFLLRNYEELPENNLGKDVDIVIEPKKYQIVAELLLDTMRYFGICYYTINKLDKLRCWYIMDNSANFAIHIDIIENEIYKGFEFYSFDILYENVIKYKNFFVLNPIFDTMMLLIQNIVAYKSLKLRYRQVISRNYDLNKFDIDKEIFSFFGKKIGCELVKRLEEGDYESIVNDSKKISRVVLKRIFLKKTFKTIIGFLRYSLKSFYRIIICPKKFHHFIAVEAPDGTGKTTFIKALINQLQFYYIVGEERFGVYHFRPTFLPNLGALGEKAGVMIQDKNFSEPHRAVIVGKFSSFVRMFYYWLDYVVGMPYLIRKNVRKGMYTIFDRYIFDFLVDPQRSRINLPLWIRRLFIKLTMKPSLVFILSASPDVIYSRKQELTKSEILCQLLLFKQLLKEYDNCFEINADQDVDSMVEDALKYIFKIFMNKVE